MGARKSRSTARTRAHPFIRSLPPPLPRSDIELRRRSVWRTALAVHQFVVHCSPFFERDFLCCSLFVVHYVLTVCYSLFIVRCSMLFTILYTKFSFFIVRCNSLFTFSCYFSLFFVLCLLFRVVAYYSSCTITNINHRGKITKTQENTHTFTSKKQQQQQQQQQKSHF